MGSGIGYDDVQLLAATLITPGAQFWTRDKRLAATAVRLGIAFDPPSLRERRRDPAYPRRSELGAVL
ncbi:MAG: hypothetical protein ACR2K2_01375 [Mycobacteriales bacterium]